MSIKLPWKTGGYWDKLNEPCDEKLLKKWGLPDDLFDNIPITERPFIAVTTWASQQLPSLKTREKTYLADQLVVLCHYYGFTPLLKRVMSPWSSAQRKAQHDMDTVYIDKLFDFP